MVIAYFPVSLVRYSHAAGACKFHVFGSFAARGGEEVARNGGVDADVDGFALYLGAELCPTAGEAEESARIDQAEEGYRGEVFLLCQGGSMLQRSACNGLEYVDGDGVNIYAAEEEGKLYPLLHALAHADNAAAADAHSYPTRCANGVEFLVLGMGAAKGGEEARSCLHIAMVGSDTMIEEDLQLLLGEQSQGSAALDVGLFLDGAVACRHPVYFGHGGCASAGDEGEATDALSAIVFGLLGADLGGEESVLFYRRGIMAALGAPLAVLRTVATLGVDDGTRVEGIAHEMSGDPMSWFV